MDKKIIVGVAAAAAVGTALYWLLRPTEEEAVKEVESSKPAPAAESKPAAPSAPKSSAPVSESKSEAAAAAAAPKEKPAAKAASSGNGSSVDKDTLKSILVEMCDKLSSMKNELAERIPEFHRAAAGDLQMAMQMYQAEVGSSLQTIEQEVQSKYSISQRELMLAQQAFSSDPEIKELVNNLKRLFFGDDADEMPDPDDIEVPEGMDADTFYAKFCTHVDIVHAAFMEAVEETMANAPKDARMQYMQMIMLRRLEEVNRAAIERIGLNEEDFQRCLLKYQADPRFYEKMQENQDAQEAARKRMLEE